MFFFYFTFFFPNFILFFLSVFGLFATRKNLIIVFMAIEIMLLAVVINFCLFSIYLNDIVGQIFSLFILGLASSESSIGLSILINNYRHKAIISIDNFSILKN